MGVWMAILAMICWGIAPLFAKAGLNNTNPIAGLILRTMIAAVIVSGWLGLSGNMQQMKTIPVNSWVLLAVEALLATILGDLAYYVAIKNEDVSVVAMIMSTSPLITLLCAAVFLGEAITAWKVIGAAYIILGIVLICH